MRQSSGPLCGGAGAALAVLMLSLTPAAPTRASRAAGVQGRPPVIRAVPADGRGVRITAAGISVRTPFVGVPVQGLRVPAVMPAPDRLPADVAPAHRELRFTAFARVVLGTTADLMPAVIRVYPTASFARFGWTQWWSALTHLLARRPLLAVQPELPFLPLLEAGQVLHARERYLRVADGWGIRYLTHYAQDVSPLSAESVFYTVQGVSADGHAYIAITFPLHSRVLEGTPVPPRDEASFERAYPRYLAQTTRRLNTAPAGAFVPRLDDLDRLVGSLRLALAAGTS